MPYTSPFRVCDALLEQEPFEHDSLTAGPEPYQGSGWMRAYVVRVQGCAVLAWVPGLGWVSTGDERAGIVVLAVGRLVMRGERVRVVEKFFSLDERQPVSVPRRGARSVGAKY